MAAALPLLLAGVPALLSGISGIMGIVKAAKGGRLRRRVVLHRKFGGLLRKKKHYKTYHKSYKIRHRGRGVVSDGLSMIPLLGSVLGPLTRSMGLGVRRHKMGHGLSPMLYRRPYVNHYGMGMVHMKKKGHGMLSPGHPSVLFLKKLAHGGLLFPGGHGGYVTHRKGYYKYMPSGKRVHVAATTVYHKKGKGMVRKCGGFRPYRF